MTAAENVTPPDAVRPQIIVAFSGTVSSLKPYVVFIPSTGRLLVRELPQRRGDQLIGDAPGVVLEQVLADPALQGVEVVVVLEGIPVRSMRRRYPGVRELLDDPRYRRVRLTIADVAGSLGLPTPPEADDVVEAAQATVGGEAGALDFSRAWVVAVALAGAARARGELTVAPIFNPTIAPTVATALNPKRVRAASASPPEPRDLMTVQDIAKHVGKSKMWVYRHVRGRIPCVRPPGARSVFYKRSDIEALVASWTAGVVEKSSIVIPITAARSSRSSTSSDVVKSISRWGLRRAKGKKK
jgi:predicted DNA-binding transcriptional regulator AlpA